MTQALDLAGAVVVRHDGSVAATEGHVAGSVDVAADRRSSPRTRSWASCGVGRTLSGVPLGGSDEALLRLSADYLAAALRTGRREDEQAAALSGLTAGTRAGRLEPAIRLYEALVRRSRASAGPARLRPGPASGRPRRRRRSSAGAARRPARARPRVCSRSCSIAASAGSPRTRSSSSSGRTRTSNRPISRSTGPSAGCATRSIRTRRRQARRSGSTTIATAWTRPSSTGPTSRTSSRCLDQAAARRPTGPSGLRLLEAARALYRGDYLDDCPFYGDSVHVEERRASLCGPMHRPADRARRGLRGRRRPGSAAAAFREAPSPRSADAPVRSAEAGPRRDSTAV